MAISMLNRFCKHMDDKGIKYRTVDERCVRISYNGDNISSVVVHVIFDKDGGHTVTFRDWEICSFKDDSKYAKGLIVCNAMNAQYRWVKFYLDDDRDVVAQCDAVVDEDTVGKECMELVLRLVNIVDEAYPNFMKALWN